MTGGKLANRPDPSQNDTARQYFEHSSAQRINTDVVVVEALRSEYPDLHLTVVPQRNCDLLAYAGAGHARLSPIDKEKDRLRWRFFLPPARRLDGQRGFLADMLMLGKFLLDWQGKEFVLVIADGRDGSSPYPEVVQQYILSGSVEAINNLVFGAGVWSNELHNEIWVYDGYWQKSAELWASVQKSNWEDVILDKDMKAAIISDVEAFFNNRDAYERLKVAWKRGVIYYGPPGNGKTISIKAMMNSLYRRSDPIPTLYVKTLASFGGPEYSVNQIFRKARQEAPCYLIFEDLDSLVTNSVRSYFLNAVDGIQRNDGIMMVGTTNHLERLDPGIAKRPSRFDRKYLFPNPSTEQRAAYMKYWQKKLADNDTIEFPDKLCPAIANITPGFSFAYLQEAIVASLLAIARGDDPDAPRVCRECLEAHEGPQTGGMCDRSGKRPFMGRTDLIWLSRQADQDDPDLDNYILWREIKKQVRILRKELGEEGA